MGRTASDENLDSFLHAQASEDFCPVEYKVVEIHTLLNDLEATLNDLGSEGWELEVWERMSGKAIFSRC